MGSPLNDRPLRVGVVGVGVISQQYFEHFPALPGLELTAVADIDVARAQSVGEAQGVRGTSVDELIAADDVDVVLNLTIPAAHAEIATRALEAASTSTARSRSRCRPPRRSPCSTSPAAPGCGSAARRTPCSAPASRRRATRSTAA